MLFQFSIYSIYTKRFPFSFTNNNKFHEKKHFHLRLTIFSNEIPVYQTLILLDLFFTFCVLLYSHSQQKSESVN